MNIKKITTENLAESTEQEVFEFIAHHLLTQKIRAMSMEGCVYRTLEGLSCAAGCLLNDEEAFVSDGLGIWNILVKNGIVPDAHAKLIRLLQIIHDGTDPQYWRETLLEFPSKYSKTLNSNFIKEIL